VLGNKVSPEKEKARLNEYGLDFGAFYAIFFLNQVKKSLESDTGAGKLRSDNTAKNSKG
jgi:hypothetical protein